MFYLITLDHELESDSAYHNDGFELRIDPLRNNTTVERIYSNLAINHTTTTAEANTVATLAEGFPQMAILAAMARKDGLVLPNNMIEIDTIDKLLFGHKDVNSAEKDVISVLSIFSKVRFPPDEVILVLNTDELMRYEIELKFIQTHLCSRISYRDFFKIVKAHKRRGIIEQRGSFIQVRPAPLAIRLAVDWYTCQPPSIIYDFVVQFSDFRELGQHAISRLTQLEGLNTAKSIAQQIWGASSPFRTAEILLSSFGSRVFLGTCRLDLNLSYGVLNSVISALDENSWIKLNHNRRNFVWALEKLTYEAETFEKFAFILFTLAKNENENLGNNATSIFCGLFQVYLSNTAATLSQRSVFLGYLQSKEPEHESTTVILGACLRALVSDRYTKLVSSDSGPVLSSQEDYAPKHREEIFDYWSAVINIIFNLEFKHDLPQLEILHKQFPHKLRGLIVAGMPIEKIGDIWKTYEGIQGYDRYTTVSVMNTVIRHDRISASIKSELQALIQYFDSDELIDRINKYVARFDYSTLSKNEDYRKAADERVREIAEILTLEELLDKNTLNVILVDHVEFGFKFGGYIYRSFGFSPEFVRSCLNQFEIGVANNPNVLYGYFNATVDKSKIIQVFEYCMGKIALQEYCFDIVRFIPPDIGLVNQLLNLSKHNKNITLKFRSFLRGNYLLHYSNDDIISIMDEIYSLNDIGKIIVLEIIQQYIPHNESWPIGLDRVKKYLTQTNYLAIRDQIRVSQQYIWVEVAERVLKRDSDFAETIANQIIELCSSYDFVSVESYFTDLVHILFDQYFQNVWPVFMKCICNGEDKVYYNLKHIILDVSSFTYANTSPFYSNINYLQSIKELTDNCGIIAAKRLIGNAPLTDANQDNYSWHPAILWLLEQYGDEEDVLRNLGSNIHSFGSVGSRVPHYILRKELCNKLLNHKYITVRQWAKMQVDYWTKSEILEQLSDTDRMV